MPYVFNPLIGNIDFTDKRILKTAEGDIVDLENNVHTLQLLTNTHSEEISTLQSNTINNYNDILVLQSNTVTIQNEISSITANVSSLQDGTGWSIPGPFNTKNDATSANVAVGELYYDSSGIVKVMLA